MLSKLLHHYLSKSHSTCPKELQENFPCQRTSLTTGLGSSWKQKDTVKSSQHIFKIFLKYVHDNIRNICRILDHHIERPKTVIQKFSANCHAVAAINLTLTQLNNTSTTAINEQGTYIYSQVKHLLQLNLSQTWCSNHKLFHTQIALNQKLPILLWMQYEKIFATWALFH